MNNQQFIEEIANRLRNMDRVERIQILLLALIEIIERQYFLVQKLKQEIKEYYEEKAKHG
jgi:flavoprotein